MILLHDGAAILSKIEKIHRCQYETSVISREPEPHNDAYRSFIDVQHIANLFVTLSDILLVNAQCVYPDSSYLIGISEVSQGVEEIRGDRK